MPHHQRPENVGSTGDFVGHDAHPRLQLVVAAAQLVERSNGGVTRAISRFATDLGNYPVLGSYGDQNPLRDVAYLYTSPVYTRSDALRAQAQAVRYVLVDWRLARSLPADGKYFPVDPDAGKYTHPLPVRDLAKFSHIPGVARVYDSGNIVIYDLGGAEHAP